MKQWITRLAIAGITGLSAVSLAAPATNAIADFAYITGGSSTPLGTGSASLKNGTGSNMKIAMYKLSTTNIVGKCTSASFNFVTKNDHICNLLVWGVKDSGATGWNWTGGPTGDVTWNTVLSKGLFTPTDNYATSYDPAEVVLLATIPVDGSGAPYNLESTVSGSGLVDLINADSDGVVTLIATVDAGVNLWARDPITYSVTGSLVTESDPNTFVLAYGADPQQGSVSGSSPQFVASGGNGTAVTAADPGVSDSFSSWSDGSTANPRTDTGVTQNVRVYAQYQLTYETLIYSAGANGTISGVATQVVATGDSGLPVEAIPDAGHVFVAWSDGQPYNPRLDSGVTSDLSVTANFAPTGTLSAAIIDQGKIAGGTAVDTPQNSSGDINLKNGSGQYTRIGMIKADVSAVSAAAENTALSLLIKDQFTGNIVVWGVKDSAANGWDWDGAVDMTWNNVIANGMFTPGRYVQDIYGDTNLVLLAEIAFSKNSQGNIPLMIAGNPDLDALVSDDTDGMLTFVVAVDANQNATIREPLVNSTLYYDALANTYGTWAVLAGLTPGVNDGMNQDVENGGLGDGMDNLMEYALGGDPLVDDAAQFLPVESVDGGYLNLVYRRRTDAAARLLTYEVLSTTDLGVVPITNPTTELPASPIDADFELVTNRVSTAVENQQFMELTITNNE